MPDWINHLTTKELWQLTELDRFIAQNQAMRRKLMNRAKQRKHRHKAGAVR